MTLLLYQLPFDILFYIASNLHVDDVVHLRQTCRQLKDLLDERTLQRCVVEVCDIPLYTATVIDVKSRRVFPTRTRLFWLVLEISPTSKHFLPYMTEGTQSPMHVPFQPGF
jgi:hypothetical protein